MPDESSGLERLKGRVEGIAELVPDMREELERHKAETAELSRRTDAVKEGSMKMSDFLELLRNMVGRHETKISGLRQARLDTPPSPPLVWTCCK